MAILEVLTYPNPLLKKKSVSIDKVTPELVQLTQDMLETMYDAPGVGLAAPQIGQNIRLTVIDTRPLDEEGGVDQERMTELERKISYPLILFNPVITKKVGKTTYEEGCLSVPGFTDDVPRASYIEVKALDKNGNEFEIHTDGLLAICIQHEIDHLDGKLFIDRLSVVKSSLIKSKIKKHGYPERSGSNSAL